MSLPPTHPGPVHCDEGIFTVRSSDVVAKALGTLVEGAFVVCHQHDLGRADVGLRLMTLRSASNPVTRVTRRRFKYPERQYSASDILATVIRGLRSAGKFARLARLIVLSNCASRDGQKVEPPDPADAGRAGSGGRKSAPRSFPASIVADLQNEKPGPETTDGRGFARS
jgi:hypothetical protein